MMAGYGLVFDGNNCGRFSTLGNLLNASQINVHHKYVKFSIPDGSADMVISGQAAGSEGNNRQEFQLSVQNGLLFITLGSTTSPLGLVNEVFGLGDGGYPYTVEGDIKYQVDMVNGAIVVLLDDTQIVNESVSIGNQRDDGQSFFIGGRNSSDSWSSGTQLRMPTGSVMGDTTVEIDGSVVLNAVSDGVGDTWENTEGPDGEIVNGNAVWKFNIEISNVNGGTIELGETGATVTMSNEITPTDLYFTDGNKEYRPTYSQSGATFTFDVPLTSDDTLPKFGTLDLVIVDADDTYSKSFEFVPPTGYELVTLENPIELDESSYTYGTNLSPTVGDYYFHAPTDDFSITGVADTTHPSNVFLPVGDAPWSHTVWYLSGAGLRETEASDGQGVIVDPNDPPTVDAGAPRSITVPDTVQLGTNVTAGDDGSIASYAWTQENGPNVSINNAGVKNASVSLTDAGTYVFRVTVTDDDGATAFDDLTVTASEAVTDSTLNATITNIPDGTYDTRVWSTTGDMLFFGPKAWSSESASFTLTDVDVGTNVEYCVMGVTDGSLDRGVTE